MAKAALPEQHGFTLVELLATLCIVGVLAIAGMPALGAMLAHSHERSAEDALQASLLHAREMAITRRIQVVVCPSTDGRQCASGDDWRRGWLIGADADRDREPDAGTSPLAAFDRLPAGMRVLASQGRPRIVFRPDGSASGTNARLTICHRNDADSGRAVVVANSGRVRIAQADPDRLRACLAGVD